MNTSYDACRGVNAKRGMAISIFILGRMAEIEVNGTGAEWYNLDHKAY